MEKKYNYERKVSIVNEDDSAMRFYASQEEQELERLKSNMNQTATEKFHSLMSMMKIGNMMKKAIIHHKA
jgi:hypothetical protein